MATDAQIGAFFQPLLQTRLESSSTGWIRSPNSHFQNLFPNFLRRGLSISEVGTTLTTLLRKTKTKRRQTFSFNKFFSGKKPRQLWIMVQCFRDHIRPHRQGAEMVSETFLSTNDKACCPREKKFSCRLVLCFVASHLSSQ